MVKFERGGAAPATSPAGPGLVDSLFEAVQQPAFDASGFFGNRHFQTIWPNRIKRDPSGADLAAGSRPTVIASEDGDRLQLFWSRHHETADGAERPRPVLVILHGLTGCADADNVLATAKKGYAAGFNVVRVDLRNSQSDTPSLGIGHAGRSEDLRAVLAHVATVEPHASVGVIGFSLGGNITLKGLGEYAEAAPGALRGAATISVPIDLDDACRAIDERRENWIYRRYFLRRLGHRYLRARELRPDLFHAIDLDRIRGIRDWDNAVVAPLGGFEDAEDYYTRNSSLRVIDKIAVPTLIIHAEDDPFIPFTPFRAAAVRDNRWLRVLATEHGGHVGFYAAGTGNGDPDRYWAENRALDFCAAATGLGNHT